MSDAIFIRPDGRKVGLDKADFKAADELGYKLVGPDEPGGGGVVDATRALGAGVLDTLTLGHGLDVIQNFDISGARRQQLAEQIKAHPVAHTVGQIVGAAPVAGASSAAIGTSTLGRAAASAAVPGALTGFESAVSEAQLENKDLTAEAAAISTLKGGLSGAAGGGLGFGLGKAVSGVGKLVGKLPSSEKPIAEAIRASGEKFIEGGAPLLTTEEAGQALMAGFLKSPIAGATVAGGYAAKNLLRGRGALMAADAIEALGGKSLSSKAVFNGISSALNSAGSAIAEGAPAALAPFMGPLSDAVAKGPDATAAMHQQLLAQYGEPYLKAVGGQAVPPEGRADTAARAGEMEALHQHTELTRAAVGRELDDFFHGKKSKYHSSDIDTAKVKEGLIALAQDSSSMIPETLWATAPETAAKIISAQQAAIQHLNDAMPKNPYFGMPKAIQPPWRASAADEDQFKRIVAVVQDPLTLLGQLRQGVAGPKEAEAVEKVYPQLFEEMRTQMLQRLQVWDKPLEYNKRLALSQVFGPQFLGIGLHETQLVQQVHAEMQAPAEGSKGPDGRQKVDVDRNLQTQAQRLEGR